VPQQDSAVPQYEVARRLRRGLMLGILGLGLAAPTAAAQSSGGAQAGDDAAARQAPATTRAAPAPSGALTRATIRAVQRKLRLKADGVLGPRTRAAIRRYQRRHRLRVTGRLFPATLAALGVRSRAAVSSRSAGPAPTGEAARILAAIAQCESGGDPRAVSPDGTYRGKYQFLVSTWEGLGGTGDPAAAPETEQDRRAAALYAAQGIKPWPVCGRRATQGS
jgi:peptidoglycan hydrolase-like protein with peptidoglycan-binding domain